MATALSVALLVQLVMPSIAAAYPRPGATARMSVAPDGSEADAGSIAPAISADGRYVAFSSSARNLVPRNTDCGTWNGLELPCPTDVFVRDRESGVIERASVASDGTDAFGSQPAISADGRYVAFRSFDRNLVEGDTNNAADVFVRDREAGTTERVSVASDGTEGSGSSDAPSISADGRYVAFYSYARTLVPDKTTGLWDVFVHDRETGATERVSVAPDGSEADAGSLAPAISADGRYVAFVSDATNLVAGDINSRTDVFVHNRETSTTERVSVASDGAEANGPSHSPSSSGFDGPAISADGRVVAFRSEAFNLVPVDGNNAEDVFVRDRETGATERVSVASDGTQANGPSGTTFGLSVSADGRYVAFRSDASNLVDGATSGVGDVFVHDRATRATELTSVTSDGAQADGPSGTTFGLSVSADGRYVAFGSSASNLVEGDTNDLTDVFVRDRGPATGIGELVMTRTTRDMVVSGWVTFSGVTLAEVDSTTTLGAGPVGADIAGASALYRPEAEDVLLRLRLNALPPQVGGAPGILYRWTLTTGGSSYEVRVMRAAATAASPSAGPYFALYDCPPGPLCTELATLRGNLGTTGPEVLVAVPLAALGTGDSVEITDLTAATGVGEAAPGILTTLDQVDLADALVPVPRVDFAIASDGTPADEVVYTTQGVLSSGHVSATLPTSALPPGDYRVWARACLGDTCGSHSVPVRL